MGIPTLDQWFQTPDQVVTVYRAVVDILQTDPLLAAMQVSWDVRKGDQNETVRPSPDQMPWIAVVPLEFSLHPATEFEDEGMFQVRIDMAVRGTNWNDLGNFSGAVRNALKRNKPFRGSDVVTYLGSAGAINYWFRRAGVGVARTQQPPAESTAGAPAPVSDQFASALYEFQLFMPNII